MLDRVGAEQTQATGFERYALQSCLTAQHYSGGEEILILDGLFRRRPPLPGRLVPVQSVQLSPLAAIKGRGFRRSLSNCRRWQTARSNMRFNMRAPDTLRQEHWHAVCPLFFKRGQTGAPCAVGVTPGSADRRRCRTGVAGSGRRTDRTRAVLCPTRLVAPARRRSAGHRRGRRRCHRISESRTSCHHQRLNMEQIRISLTLMLGAVTTLDWRPLAAAGKAGSPPSVASGRRACQITWRASWKQPK